MADVEMKDAKSKGDVKDAVETPPLSPVAEMKSNVALIERAVSTLEPRFTIRVLRSLTALRKRLDDKALCDAVSEVYSQGVLVNASHRFTDLISPRFSDQVLSALVAP
jgi:26S proteasome regulatory subunit N3